MKSGTKAESDFGFSLFFFLQVGESGGPNELVVEDNIHEVVFHSDNGAVRTKGIGKIVGHDEDAVSQKVSGVEAQITGL